MQFQFKRSSNCESLHCFFIKKIANLRVDRFFNHIFQLISSLNFFLNEFFCYIFHFLSIFFYKIHFQSPFTFFKKKKSSKEGLREGGRLRNQFNYQVERSVQLVDGCRRLAEHSVELVR